MKRKKKNSLRKRTTFLKLFLKSGIIALICTAVFANAFRMMLCNKIGKDINEHLEESARNITAYIGRSEAEEKPLGDVSAYMSMQTRYFIFVDAFEWLMRNNPTLYQLNSDYGDKNNFTISAITDEDGNILASSRAKICAVIKFGKGDKDNGRYSCDLQKLDSPEAKQFYDEYFDLLKSRQIDYDHYVSLDIKSAYVDKTNHTFIPHEAYMMFDPNQENEWSDLPDEASEGDVRHLSIDIDDDNYELVTFQQDVTGDSPSIHLAILYGTLWETFDNSQELTSLYKNDWMRSYGWYGNYDEYTCLLRTPVYAGGKQCTLNMYYRFVTKGTIVELHYRIGTALFGVISILLALLWAWQKNVRNKARYAFEEYQRDLTDRLAHDIKTPLMAISGYAENVLNGKLSDEERTEYLTSILDNVSFTDSLISRTLYLNHMDENHTLKQEAIQLNDMVEEILEKYALLLHERKISYSVSGNTELNADRASMETIIENLISNVVKYASENGSLKIEIDKKYMTIANSVAEKIDTKELTQPFVRGDSARSNADGNGLGLAIAERAALVNGFKLSVSCTDTEFRTEVRF